MPDASHMKFGLGEANLRVCRLSGDAAADTRNPNVQKALMEYLLLGKINS